MAGLKEAGAIDHVLDPDMLRMSFVSLAITPTRLKEVFEEQLGREIGEAFLEQLAALNGRLLSEGMKPNVHAN